MKIFSIKFRSQLLISVVFAFFLIMTITIIFCHFYHTAIHMHVKNYTAILKDVHDNAYEYSGEKIKLSGYVYRAPDFHKNQFVIARNMKLTQTDYRIVGFLCESDFAISLENHTWIKAEGMITLGDYHGPMPIIKISNLRIKKAPKDISVPPPK